MHIVIASLTTQRYGLGSSRQEEPPLSEPVAFAEEEMRRVLRALSADMQASLALSRAALGAIASMSPALNAAAEAAIDREIERVSDQAPSRVLEVLEDMRDRVQAIPDEADKMSALERALVAAADALPDFPVAGAARA